MYIEDLNVAMRNMHYNTESGIPCKVTLQNKDLWNKFHQYTTEMIITKSGRRMFPSLRVQVKDLEPNTEYCILVEMVPLNSSRYKYTPSGGWVPAGTEDAQSPNRLYIHPESPATGQHWMSQIVSFGRLKLTNTINPPSDQLVLSSMHRYQPRIVIVKTSDRSQILWSRMCSFTFEETQFIAVTAYQNDKITQLKIDHNPFAKGFRENGQAKCRRKRQSSSSGEDIDVVDDDNNSPPDSLSSSSEKSISPPIDANNNDEIYERLKGSPEASKTPPFKHHTQYYSYPTFPYFPSYYSDQLNYYTYPYTYSYAWKNKESATMQAIKTEESPTTIKEVKKPLKNAEDNEPKPKKYIRNDEFKYENLPAVLKNVRKEILTRPKVDFSIAAILGL